MSKRPIAFTTLTFLFCVALIPLDDQGPAQRRRHIPGAPMRLAELYAGTDVT